MVPSGPSCVLRMRCEDSCECSSLLALLQALCGACNESHAQCFESQQPSTTTPGQAGGRKDKRARSKEKKRSRGMQRAISEALWLGIPLLLHYGQTVINVRRKGCCEDSPRVKCPTETTAQCVYFLRLLIRRHYSSFSACACQPRHLQTRTQKKCRCSGKMLIYRARQKDL